MAWKTSYYHYDAVGSTRGITDEDQDFRATYPQLAFGQPLVNSSDVENPFRFVGRLGYYYDQASDSFQVRQRPYRADLARWLSQDQARSDHNLYRYVGNSPLRSTDPSGLAEEDAIVPLFPPERANRPSPEFLAELRQLAAENQVAAMNQRFEDLARALLVEARRIGRSPNPSPPAPPRRDGLGSWSGWFNDKSRYYQKAGGLYAIPSIINGILVVPAALIDTLPGAIRESSAAARKEISRTVARSNDPVTSFIGSYVAIPLTHVGEAFSQFGNAAGAAAPLMTVGATVPAIGSAMTNRATIGALSTYGLRETTYNTTYSYYSGTLSGSDVFFVAGSAAGLRYTIAPFNPFASELPVSHWGQPGLRSGDWVMRGRADYLNYLLSGKIQRGFTNIHAPFSSGQTFIVPRSSIIWPSGFEFPKGFIEHRRYVGPVIDQPLPVK